MIFSVLKTSSSHPLNYTLLPFAQYVLAQKIFQLHTYRVEDLDRRICVLELLYILFYDCCLWWCCPHHYYTCLRSLLHYTHLVVVSLWIFLLTQSIMKNLQKHLFVFFIQSTVKSLIKSLNNRLLLVFDGHPDVGKIIDKKFHSPQTKIILLSLHKLNR